MDAQEDTIARDLIIDVGPMGDTYLTHEHTLLRLGSREYLQPRVSVNGSYSSWQARGGTDTYQLAREEARRLGQRPVPNLTDARRRAMDEIIQGFRA